MIYLLEYIKFHFFLAGVACGWAILVEFVGYLALEAAFSLARFYTGFTTGTVYFTTATVYFTVEISGF
jgi:hypothetical protein